MSAATIAMPQANPLARVRAILIGSMGNLIEWYDVYAYSAFALYFSGSFFNDPDERPLPHPSEAHADANTSEPEGPSGECPGRF